ncbi:hypothetical protein SAMN05421869_15411 [Nonomuraea jiangxiensis]|uniref:Uncharacterized protein n=1 Tax=Nonomuraea jiangxiensis TaxID=633440 RepID=A0A1G9VPZ8_9ACTN|nr:hypothetical protein SAMN05421869_15411 [Nonomuraea jiangxiensis]
MPTTVEHHDPAGPGPVLADFLVRVVRAWRLTWSQRRVRGRLRHIQIGDPFRARDDLFWAYSLHSAPTSGPLHTMVG